jgi:hypothetical protein
MTTCENCGCRVYALGCVNCNEIAYIEQQEAETNRQIREQQLQDARHQEKARG